MLKCYDKFNLSINYTVSKIFKWDTYSWPLLSERGGLSFYVTENVKICLWVAGLCLRVPVHRGSNALFTNNTYCTFWNELLAFIHIHWILHLVCYVFNISLMLLLFSRFFIQEISLDKKIVIWWQQRSLAFLLMFS